MSRKKRPPIDLDRIDRVIHEPARLALAAHLSVVEEADFVYLVRQTGLSPGNAGTHLKRLEEAGYLRATKGFENNRPQTTYALTKEGRSALERYRDAMTTLLANLQT